MKSLAKTLRAHKGKLAGGTLAGGTLAVILSLTIARGCSFSVKIDPVHARTNSIARTNAPR